MSSNEGTRIAPLLRGLVGAALGGVLGYFIFEWILRQGFYAMALPGAAVGLGFGLLARERSIMHGVICAVLGLGLGLVLEWRFFPFIKDDSFSFFISHVHQLKPLSQMMIVMGGIFACWFGIGRSGTQREASQDVADS